MLNLIARRNNEIIRLRVCEPWERRSRSTVPIKLDSGEELTIRLPVAKPEENDRRFTSRECDPGSCR